MRWKYKVVIVTLKMNLEEELNVYGVEGWELISTYFYGQWTLLFKKLVNK